MKTAIALALFLLGSVAHADELLTWTLAGEHNGSGVAMAELSSMCGGNELITGFSGEMDSLPVAFIDTNQGCLDPTGTMLNQEEAINFTFDGGAWFLLSCCEGGPTFLYRNDGGNYDLQPLSLTFAAVPEPATEMYLAIGLLALLWLSQRRDRSDEASAARA